MANNIHIVARLSFFITFQILFEKTILVHFKPCKNMFYTKVFKNGKCWKWTEAVQNIIQSRYNLTLFSLDFGDT